MTISSRISIFLFPISCLSSVAVAETLAELDASQQQRQQQYQQAQAEKLQSDVDIRLDTTTQDRLTKTRANGDSLMYNPDKNIFISITKDGSPRTMFKPENGLEYWEKQK